MLIVTMIPTNNSNLQQLQQMVKDRESLLDKLLDQTEKLRDLITNVHSTCDANDETEETSSEVSKNELITIF